MLIPLTVPERQRHGLRWSCWRRAHQATAKRCHTKRRARRDMPMPRATRTIGVPGTPMLTDALWLQLAPFLPPHHGKRGRMPSDHRPILDGLLWMMGTGRGWRDIPPQFGPWHTIYRRYRHWRRDGTWARVVAAMSTDAT